MSILRRTLIGSASTMQAYRLQRRQTRFVVTNRASNPISEGVKNAIIGNGLKQNSRNTSSKRHHNHGENNQRGESEYKNIAV